MQACGLLASLAVVASDRLAAAELTIAPTLQRFDYREFAPGGALLDREEGVLSGFAAAVEFAPSGDWQFGAAGRWLAGRVDYDGQTQAGEPHRTRTSERLLRLQGQARRCLDGCPGRWVLLAGLAASVWQRDIESRGGVSGLAEQYRWWELELGARVRLADGPAGSWHALLGALQIYRPEVEVDLRRFGIGSPTLALEERPGLRAELDWRAHETGELRWGVGLVYERWEFGASDTLTRSDGATLFEIAEPDSRSEHLLLQLRLRVQ